MCRTALERMYSSDRHVDGRLRYAFSEIFPRGEAPEKCRSQGQRDCVEGKDLGVEKASRAREKERERLVPTACASTTSEKRARDRAEYPIFLICGAESKFACVGCSCAIRDYPITRHYCCDRRPDRFRKSRAPPRTFIRARGRPCLFASRAPRTSQRLQLPPVVVYVWVSLAFPP